MDENSLPMQAVIDECLPVLKKLAQGRYAISIGGSQGKGISDTLSDIDFRLFCDEAIPDYEDSEVWQTFCQIVDDWREKGVYIDHCWIRNIAAIDTQLDGWVSGNPQPLPIIWTIWGYYLPIDLMNQIIVDDPEGIIAAWQTRLTPYPENLRSAIIQKYMNSLKFWRTDYHYQNKVKRGDVVFLAGLTSRLVHEMIQILFALNRTFYVGDGKNLHYVDSFATKPDNFVQQVNTILYPQNSDDRFTVQYDAVIALIDDIEALVKQ